MDLTLQIFVGKVISLLLNIHSSFFIMRTMPGAGSAPSCCAFTHRVAFEEGSGPRVLLIKKTELMLGVVLYKMCGYLVHCGCFHIH